ncbi:hypothetical protein [Marinimicrobium sp. ABcell2]|uniref:hypothetical protein n=1 Tax=Marinimicrobium sp. ABcell2 TaxID=3069751 RepID=UPI0027B72F51|nr:hypothetical protein [Marinimicrobium sp. ABcell2]MDQ2077457.1 hypothetical protein [Marinimicrobium sp. ABcell2]
MAQTIPQHEINRKFLDTITAEAKELILNSIAKHYAITQQAVLDEVTGEGAEHLLEYMVEPERSGASALMQRQSSMMAFQRRLTRPAG